MGVAREKVFTCKHAGCDKSFSRHDFLQRHAVNHMEVKPFWCWICGTNYARKDILEKHQRSKGHQKQAMKLSSERSLYTPNDPKSSVQITPLLPSVPAPETQTILSVSPLSQSQALRPRSEDSEEPMNIYQSSMADFLDNYEWLFGPSLVDETTRQEPVFDAHSENDSSGSSIAYDQCEKPDVHIDSNTYYSIENLLKWGSVEGYILSVSSMNAYLDLFWTRFNLVYPMIHRATFHANSTNMFLLSNMISIGMMYSNTHQEKLCAMSLQSKLRKLLLTEIDPTVEMELALLQSFILNAFFESFFGNENQVKVEQLFHGTTLNLVKFSGFLDKLKEPQLKPMVRLSPEEIKREWHKWIEYETKKRTAFVAYVFDAQTAARSKLQPLISAFDVHLELPCSDTVWNAESPLRFYQEYKRQPHDLRTRVKFESMHRRHSKDWQTSPLASKMGDLVPAEGKWPHFLFSLRRLMQPYKHRQKEYPMNCFSQFSRYIFLHGIIGICLDLKWRGLFDLGIISQKRMVEFSERMEAAFLNWRDYFDRQIMLTNNKEYASSHEQDEVVLNDYGVSYIFWANLTALQLGLLLLRADNELFINYAERFAAKSTQKTHSAQKLASWAISKEGITAACDACQVLGTVLSNEGIVQTVGHIPFVLVFSTLCVWCFECSREHHGTVSLEKYLRPDGKLDEYTCKEDALKYATDVDSIVHEDSIHAAEIGSIRRQRVIGLLAYTNILLKRFAFDNMKKEISLLERVLMCYE